MSVARGVHRGANRREGGITGKPVGADQQLWHTANTVGISPANILVNLPEQSSGLHTVPEGKRLDAHRCNDRIDLCFCRIGKRRLRTFIVDTQRTDVIGDEPVWHGDKVCGWITSGGYAHASGVSVALGYVEKELADSEGPWSIEILGQRFPARLQRVPLFDADGKRQRG